MVWSQEDCAPLHRGPPRPLSFHESLEGLTELKRAMMLTVTVYYRERIQPKISKEKRHVGWSWRESRHKLLVVLPQWSSTDRAAAAHQGSVTTWLTWTAPCPGPQGPSWYSLTQGHYQESHCSHKLCDLAQGPGRQVLLRTGCTRGSEVPPKSHQGQGCASQVCVFNTSLPLYLLHPFPPTSQQLLCHVPSLTHPSRHPFPWSHSSSPPWN